MVDCPMFTLAQKLRDLKLELKTWNKEVFGDVHLNVERAQAEVDKVQAQIIALGYLNSLLDKEKTMQLELHKDLLYQ